MLLPSRGQSTLCAWHEFGLTNKSAEWNVVREGFKQPWTSNTVKVTVQFERYFRLMEHISVISCRNPINLYITEKLVKFSKTLFNFYLVISNK